MTLDVIHKSLWGSHAWGLQHEGSDRDVFIVYITPTREILRSPTGVRGWSIRNKQDTHLTDEMKHEVGHVIQMLIGGNVNYLIGVMSPAVEQTTPAMESLQKILRNYPSKAVFHSAMGLADGNFKKYILMRQEDTPKKRSLIMRNLLFATRVIEDGVYDFNVVTPDQTWSIEEMGDAFLRLKKSFEASTLRKEYPKDLLMDWLLEARLKNLEKK